MRHLHSHMSFIPSFLLGVSSELHPTTESPDVLFTTREFKLTNEQYILPTHSVRLITFQPSPTPPISYNFALSLNPSSASLTATSAVPYDV